VVVVAAAALATPGSVEAASSNPSPAAEDCARGQNYLKVHRDDDAVEAFKAGLEKNPAAKCAIEGLEEAGPSEPTRLRDEIVECITNGLFYIGLFLVLVLLLLLLGYQPHLGRLMRHIWVVRRILAPRVTIETLEDEAVEGKPGAPFTARVKGNLKRARDEAESEDASEYSLDFGTPEQEFADVVSDSGGLKSSLEKATEISDQTKVVGALLHVVYGLLPIPRFGISGAAEPPSSRDVSATLLLEKNAKLEGTIRVQDKKQGKGNPTAGDYVLLADPAAVWIQYEFARVLDSKAVELDAAKSWLLVRKGLNHYKKKEAKLARASFGEARRCNRRNWAAVLGIAMIEARLEKRFDRAIARLEKALEEIEGHPDGAAKANPPRPHDAAARTLFKNGLVKLVSLENPTEGAPHLVDPDYYRIGYQLVAQRLNTLPTHSKGKEKSSAGGGAVDALKLARKLREQSYEVRKWLWRRSQAPGWRLWNSKLTPREQRLFDFLYCTVEPCLDIAIAAAKRHKGQRASGKSLEELHDRAREGTLSYRALYNLACYEAGEKRDEEALKYLGQVFRKAPGDRAAELFRWAPKDPSLAHLSKSQAFKDLLSEYGA
jgi:tetratricopeptide (TPR) repeat protein